MEALQLSCPGSCLACGTDGGGLWKVVRPGNLNCEMNTDYHRRHQMGSREAVKGLCMPQKVRRPSTHVTKGVEKEGGLEIEIDSSKIMVIYIQLLFGLLCSLRELDSFRQATRYHQSAWHSRIVQRESKCDRRVKDGGY